MAKAPGSQLLVVLVVSVASLCWGPKAHAGQITYLFEQTSSVDNRFPTDHPFVSGLITIDGTLADLPTIPRFFSCAQGCAPPPPMDFGALQDIFVAVTQEPTLTLASFQLANSGAMSPDSILFFARGGSFDEIINFGAVDPLTGSVSSIVDIGADGPACVGPVGTCVATGFWVVAEVIPEPPTVALLLVGLLAVGFGARLRRRPGS